MISSSLQKWAAATPAAVALEWPRFALTYRDFFDLVSEARDALVECGVQPGCRVGLLAGRSPEVYVGYGAIAATGASVVPLSTIQPRERLADQIGRADVSVVTGTVADTDVLRSADEPELCRVGLDIGVRPVLAGTHVKPRPTRVWGPRPTCCTRQAPPVSQKVYVSLGPRWSCISRPP